MIYPTHSEPTTYTMSKVILFSPGYIEPPRHAANDSRVSVNFDQTNSTVHLSLPRSSPHKWKPTRGQFYEFWVDLTFWWTGLGNSFREDDTWVLRTGRIFRDLMRKRYMIYRCNYSRSAIELSERYRVIYTLLTFTYDQLSHKPGPACMVYRAYSMVSRVDI